MRSLIALSVLVGALLLGWLIWRNSSSPQQSTQNSSLNITKQPVNFTNRTFDPTAPPPDMPPLAPQEEAACDSNFQSIVSVGAQTRLADAIHATVIVTHINVNLQLTVAIWVPTNASQHVIEHEDGHRQISEFYYQSADQLVRGIAAKYLNQQTEIAGSDLNAESNKLLLQIAANITAEYNRELNLEPTQLLYDNITDHSRNEVAAKDALDHALKNVTIEAPQSTHN